MVVKSIDFISELNNLATNFGLENIKDVKIIEVRPIIFVVYDYLCGSPMFNYFEKDMNNRLFRVNEFIESEAPNFLNEPCGCVGRPLHPDNLNFIKDASIRNELIRINKIVKKFKTVIVTSPVDKEVLFHELVHLLLEYNNILFTDWRWNEGLVTYLVLYHKKQQALLNEKNVAQGIFYEYVKYAKKWKKLLEDKVPEERLLIIKKKLKEDINN